MSKSLISRVARVEAYSGIETEAQHTVFFEVIDGRKGAYPDSPAPISSTDHTDVDVIGVWEWRSGGRRLARLPGEGLGALHARACAALPDCRVFFNAYGSSEGAAFDAALEAPAKGART